MPGERNTDAGVVAALGLRVAQHRIALNLTQAELADRAGVGRSTVQRLERGESIQLLSMVKLLRALGHVEALDAALPSPPRSPLADLERDLRRRRRVRHSAGETQDESGTEPWTWGEEQRPA